jgi:hypothetical protein
MITLRVPDIVNNKYYLSNHNFTCLNLCKLVKKNLIVSLYHITCKNRYLCALLIKFIVLYLYRIVINVISWLVIYLEEVIGPFELLLSLSISHHLLSRKNKIGVTAGQMLTQDPSGFIFFNHLRNPNWWNSNCTWVIILWSFLKLWFLL